jgi:DNA-binding CsgD family transcriptional regulator
LQELGMTKPDPMALPAEIHAVAARLRQGDADPASAPPVARVQSRRGRWLTVHASWLPMGQEQDRSVAVILQPAAPIEVAEIVMLAYRLTDQERVLTGLVCRGLSTRQISAQLHLSEYTVQDHLKSVFDKTGVRSRRDLVATILRQHYLPAAKQGWPLAANGYFR